MSIFSNYLQSGALEYLKTLRSLRLSTYPNIDDFNIPEIINDVDNLRELWIDAPEPPKRPDVLEAGVGGGSLPVTQSVATDLRNEMQGILPAKLSTIILSGSGFIQLADNILDVTI